MISLGVSVGLPRAGSQSLLVGKGDAQQHRGCIKSLALVAQRKRQ